MVIFININSDYSPVKKSSGSGQALAARKQVGIRLLKLRELGLLLCRVNLGACAVTRHLAGPLGLTGNLGNLVGGIPARKCR